MGNKNGSFTVKSAYYVAKELAESGTIGESSINHLVSPIWKKIWQLKVSSKVKIFAWCVCMDGLPTMFNLRRRGLNSTGFCPICDKDMESISHALLHCNHAKQTWAFWHDCPVYLAFSTHDLMDIMAQLIKKGSSSNLDLFYMVAWTIWGNRNNAIHNNAGCPPSQAWEIAKRALLEFNNSSSHDLPSHPTAKTQWTPPPPRFHKINVDGATKWEIL